MKDTKIIGRTVDQRASEIGMSRAFLYLEHTAGRLRFTKFGRSTRILDEDWRRYLDDRRAASQTEAA